MKDIRVNGRIVKIPTVGEVEDALGEPAMAWTARCHEIASRIVDAGLIKMRAGRPRAVYGHWRGPIERGSYFAGRAGLPFVRHGWILLDGKTGHVLDPTRWVFEGAFPYLFHGAPTKGGGWPYDEGGNVWMQEHLRPCPVAKANGDRFTKPIHRLQLSPRVCRRFTLPLNMSLEQVGWLANMPYSLLGDDAGAVYQAIERAGHGALIPFDNRRKAEAEQGA